MEADMDGVIAPTVAARHPIEAGLSFRADDCPGLPVDRERRNIEALPRLGLPTGIGPHRADQIDLMIPVTADQQVCIDVTSIGKVSSRQQTLVGQGLMDRGGHVDVANRCRGGLDVGDQVRRISIAGQVNLVAGPGCAALITVAGIGVVGGVKARPGWRQIGGLAPTDHIVLEMELVGTPERLDGREFTQPSRRRRGINRHQNCMPVGADPLTQCGPCRLAFGQAVFFDPGGIPFEPVRSDQIGQPYRRDRSQTVQGRA